MPGGGAVTLGEIVGKLGVLRVECDRCARAGQYLVANLVHKHGVNATLPEVLADISANCPRRQSTSTDMCQACMPDLVELKL